MSPTEAKRVAIVGGGCTGVTSYWALQHYSANDVHLFEASSILGGRVRTVPFEYDETHANISTEISCFNAEASPNFNSLLRSLRLSTSRRSFIFGATAGAEVYEWRRNILWSVFVRPWNFCSLEKCRVLFDIVRLKYLVLQVLMERSTTSDACSTNAYDYLLNEGFSISFQDKYLTPLLSALWGTNAGRFLPRISMAALAHFLYDHKLHRILKTALRWRHLDVTASQFIQRMATGFPPNKVHMMTKVQEVRRIGKKGYRLLMSNGEEMNFDRVVFALDSQEAFQLLKSTIGVEEAEILRGIGTIKNIAVLHSDFLLMPNAQISPCYNYILSSNTNKNSSDNSNDNRHQPPSASLTYNINALQNISSSLSGPIAITVNPFTPPHPRHVQAVWEFTDTEISSKTLDIQHRKLPSIQNKDGLSYCSVWTGRGFFEDAVTAAFQVVVDHLGVELPFEVTTQHPHFDNHSDTEDTITLGIRDHLVLTWLELLRVHMRAFELLITLLDLFWDLSVAAWYPTQERR